MHISKSMIKPVLGAVAAIGLAIALVATVQPQPTNAADKMEGIRELRDIGDAFVAIAEEASPAVVYIQVEAKLERTGLEGESPFDLPGDLFERFFGPEFRERFRQQQQPNVPRFRRGQGSGFIISEDGYILTNNHVVQDADRISVTLGDGREFTGEVVGTDPPTDVAVVKIEGDDLPYLKLGDSDDLHVGEWVLAIGNPFGLQHSVTAGIVSATGRTAVGITDFADFIQTDAAINPGNSGGPLLNLNGEVIGLNTAILSRTGGNMGIGFAIPIKMASLIKDQLIDDGTVERGFLGVMIQDVTPEIADFFGVDENTGALVADVNEGTPADMAGLQRDDVILKYDNKPVEGAASLRNLVALTKPGAKARMTVLRDGEQKVMTVTIGKREGEQVAQAGPTQPQEELGLRLQNLTEELAQRFGYEDKQGVLVAEVAPGSAAARAGLRPGMLIQEVNRHEVNNTREFREALSDTRDGVVLMRVTDDRGSRYLTVRME